jgi:hypothetical protein
MSDASHPSDYERSDADPRLVVALAVGVAAFLIVTPFALLAVYPGSHRLEAAARPLPPPQPRLQVDPRADLARLHAEEQAQLTGYGWIDRNRQIVRIPIDSAMKLLAERGWPPDAAQPAPK